MQAGVVCLVLFDTFHQLTKENFECISLKKCQWIYFNIYINVEDLSSYSMDLKIAIAIAITIKLKSVYNIN